MESHGELDHLRARSGKINVVFETGKQNPVKAPKPSGNTKENNVEFHMRSYVAVIEFAT